MLRLSKKVEYALLAMQLMAARPHNVVSAKDISVRFNISAALVAKVLQALTKAGLVQSYYGVNGGYELARSADTISVQNVVQAIEGPHTGIVDCQVTPNGSCSVLPHCTIQQPLAVLHHRLESTLASMTVAELSAAVTAEHA